MTEQKKFLQVADMIATEFVDKKGGIFDVSLRQHETYGLEAHCTHRTEDYTVIYTYAEFQTKLASDDLVQRVKTV